MRLEQYRECDGSCCRRAPRFPNKDGTDCLYRDPSTPNDGSLYPGGCKLLSGREPYPEIDFCPALPDMTPREAVKYSCEGWPQNTNPGDNDIGDCCHRWGPGQNG